MNKTTFKTLALIFLMHAIAMSSNAQDPQKAKMTTDGRGYLEYLPADYANTTELYPAIIFLHGSGERGTGTPTDLAKVTANGPPKHIKNGHKMCFTVNGKTECFIVLSPQTNDWSWKYDVIPFVKYALANYRIDPTRVYLTGLSMGGEGTWFGASLEDNAPNYFAAIAPMCGRAAVSDGTNVANKRIAVWAFHGDADTAIPLSAGQRPITGMIQANANPAPIFTIYAGGTHATAWDRGYRTDHTYHTPNLYEWLLTKTLSAAAPPPPNTAPVVNAGADQNLTMPVSTLSITASASDPDGTIAAYTWTKASGPAATLTNTTSQTLSVTSLTSGTYSFNVTVTDNQNATATDQVVVVVNPSTNQAPVVNAGTDQTITLPANQVSLTATASDTDGSIASYAWSKISGPAATLTNTTSQTLSVTSLTSGTYTFNVTVTDNLNATASDQIVVIVNPSANQAPVVNAGTDQTITLPVNQVSLTATASDTDGNIASYVWSKISGPAATLTNASTPTLSVTGMNSTGTYSFTVKVTDNQGATATDQVTVIVKSQPVNQAPAVTAGADQTITLPLSQVSLTASATDTDGTIASYAWTMVSGPAATLTNTTTSTLSVTAMTAGTYSFSVTATDNLGATATDQVTVIVNAAPVNQAPVVEAGEKQYITLPAHTATFTAVASDADGTITSYTWKKIGGSSTITMVGTSTASLSVSNVVAGTYVFRVEVSDNNGAKAADTVRLKVNPPLTSARQSTSGDFASDDNATEFDITLGQNYPNPVTSTTTIPFTVDTDQHVTIKLYNITGYEVATVINEQVSTGEHAVQFDAEALRSSKTTANAVYYYKLIANGKVITKQLVIL
jgi:dienelactone hydrolase